MKKKLHFSLFFLLISSFVSAQTFSGTVVGENGMAVPYAALYLKEIKSGFIADAEGRFETRLPQGEYTCEVSSLGFVSQQLTFRMGDTDYHCTIRLTERIYRLPEINFVRGREDPAYAVMRKAIAHASYHSDRIRNFKARVYLKGTGKGTSIPAVLKLSREVRKMSKKHLDRLFVMEEQQDISFVAPDNWTRKILATRSSFPDEVKIEMGLSTINPYAPKIFDKISPLSKNAFTFYRFRLDGYYLEDGQMINKIRVIPKRNDSRLLSGDLFVVENLWSVSAADFSLRGTGFKASVKLLCKEIQPALFLPSTTNLAMNIDLMGFKAEASYLASVRYTEVNSAAVDSLSIDTLKALVKKQPAKRRKYERPSAKYRENTEVDSLAERRDSIYWDTLRSVPLRLEELQSYKLKEIRKQSESSQLRDTLRKDGFATRVINNAIWGKTFRTTDKNAWLTLPGIKSYFPEYNPVDGFWIGMKLQGGVKISSSSRLLFSPSLYYATARNRWLGEGKLTLEYAPRRLGFLSLSGGVISADYNGESGESRLINAFSSLITGHNHVKLHEKRFLAIEQSIEPFNGVSFSAGFSWQRRTSLENHVNKSLFGRRVEPNLPKHEMAAVPMPDNEVFKLSFGLDYTPARYYRISSTGRKLYEPSRYPTFSVTYDRALPINGARYLSSYHLVQFSAVQTLSFGMFNQLYWKVNGGMFVDGRNMQLPDFKHFASTRIAVTARSFNEGFSLSDNYELATDTRWLQAHVSWYTPYLLLKHLPFLSHKSLSEGVHIRSLVVFDKTPYSELGYSIGWNNLLRVGVFGRFDNLKFRTAGISLSLLFPSLNR